MALSRRGFLGSLITAGLAAAIDPEELLWMPGKKKIFIPPIVAAPRDGWRYNPYSDLRSIDFREIEFDSIVQRLRSLPGPVRSVSSWGK